MTVTYHGVFNKYIENVKKQTGEKPIVISVGSGLGYHEVLVEKYTKVLCYDQDITKCKATNKTQAHFPQDNEKILPKDCSNVILFSAFPRGYLGDLLETYMERRGRMLCVVTCGGIDLDESWHIHFEPEDGAKLLCGINELIKGDTGAENRHVSWTIGGRIDLACSLSPGTEEDTLITFYGDWSFDLLKLYHIFYASSLSKTNLDSKKELTEYFPDTWSGAWNYKCGAIKCPLEQP